MLDDTIRFQEADYDLAGLDTLAWDMLAKGAQFGRDPLHTGVLSTISHDDYPASRTMVLRQVDTEKRWLAAYSDVRAPKARLLEQHRVSWVFYDARRRVELRAMGRMRVFAGPGDPLAESVWASMSPSAQHAFSGELATGSRLAARAPDTVVPGLTAEQVLAHSSQNYGNFAVLLTFVERLEFLYLHHAGHHRARFVYHEETLADAYWVST